MRSPAIVVSSELGQVEGLLPAVEETSWHTEAPAKMDKMMKKNAGSVSLPSLLQAAQPHPMELHVEGLESPTLRRPPRWRCTSSTLPKNMAPEHIAEQRRLKKLLREKRKSSRSVSECRHLVGSSMTGDDASVHRQIDRQEAIKSFQRIEDHMRGCSHARHELVEMQKKMGRLCATREVSANLRQAFSGSLDKIQGPESDGDCVETE